MRKLFSRTEAYDKVHFAVMAIENGAQKMNIICLKGTL